MLSINIVAIVLLLVLETLTMSEKRKSNNFLENQHLRVLWARRGGEYNSSYVGTKLGGVMLDYLAARFHFRYTYITAKEIYLYPVGQSKRGLVNYLHDGAYIISCMHVFLRKYCKLWNGLSSITTLQQIDLLVHDVGMTIQNYEQMDISVPYFQTNYYFMVPVPHTTTNNIGAVVRPFRLLVWLTLAISVFATIFTFKLIQWSQSSRITLSSRTFVAINISRNHRDRVPVNSNYSSNLKKITHWNPYLYVFGILLSQGGLCARENLSSRLVAGVWCVATFVFVQAYTSTLVTHVVTPSTSPLLVESVYDVVNKPEINLIVEAGRSLENLISTAQENRGLFKQLRNKLETFPKTRCYRASECVSLVKTGPNIVHVNAYPYLADYMIADFKETGQCDLMLAKESFWQILAGWGLPKRSFNTEAISKGILEMRENGLIEHWDDSFRSIPGQCQFNFKRSQNKPPKKAKTARISIRNLTGAFAIFLAGLCLAFVTYGGEHVIYWIHHNRPFLNNGNGKFRR